MSEAGLYDLMAAWMTGINGKPVATNRRMVALWIKKNGAENVQRVFDHVKSKANPPVEPVAYIGKLLASGLSASEPVGAVRDTESLGRDSHDFDMPRRNAAVVVIPAHRDTDRIRIERDAILNHWKDSARVWLLQQSAEVRAEAEAVVKARAWLLAQRSLLNGQRETVALSPDDEQGVLDRVATRRGWKAEEPAQSIPDGLQGPLQAAREETGTP